MTTTSLAFDRASVRRSDVDGHMHVEITNISKANVCPYNGNEIPDWESLGLDPNRVYQLLRDPEELAKGAATFNGKPLLLVHKPISARDHPADLVVGAVSNAIFEAPYLKASLVIWPGPAIEAIEDGTQKELSSGYRYTPDMTPGTYQGVRYDGVMRNIIGNHVALVEEGRAGKDVVIGDSKHKETGMHSHKLTLKGAVAQGALAAFLRPKLAQDSKIDLRPILASVTAANFRERKPAIVADVTRRASGKLAQDANLEGLVELLDAIEDEPAADADMVTEPNTAVPVKKAQDDDVDTSAMDSDDAELRAFLKSKGMSDEDIAKVCGMMTPTAATDEPPPPIAGTPKTPKVAAADADTGKEKDMKDIVDKQAMDSAIRNMESIIVKRMQDAAEAREFVRPHVGILPMALDSAEAVLRAAADALKIPEAATVHASALRPLISMKVASNHPITSTSRVAMDSLRSAEDEFRRLVPDAKPLIRA